jgi:hypothetical protein
MQRSSKKNRKTTEKAVALICLIWMRLAICYPISKKNKKKEKKQKNAFGCSAPACV